MTAKYAEAHTRRHSREEVVNDLGMKMRVNMIMKEGWNGRVEMWVAVAAHAHTERRILGSLTRAAELQGCAKCDVWLLRTSCGLYTSDARLSCCEVGAPQLVCRLLSAGWVQLLIDCLGSWVLSPWGLLWYSKVCRCSVRSVVEGAW